MKKITTEEVGAQREIYLEEVSRTLRDQLLPLEAYETIQEMREHLDAMAAAYQELGLEPADAMKAAIQKFGESRKVAEQLGAVSGRMGVREWATGVAFSMLSTAALGAALLAAVDLGTIGQIIDMDLLVGSIAGAVFGASAWIFPARPLKFSGFWSVVVTAIALYMLWHHDPFWPQFTWVIDVIALTIAATLAAGKIAKEARRFIQRTRRSGERMISG